jgi:hypothetical protein
LSSSAVGRKVASGLLIPVDRGTYRMAGSSPSWEQAVMAAVLGSGGIAAVRAAARLWGLDRYRTSAPEVIVPVGWGYRREGVIVHESVDFDEAKPCVRRGIPVTDPVRTVIDLGTRVPTTWQSDALDEVLRRKLATWPDFYHQLALLAARGRNGVGTFREVLDSRFGEVIPGSAWNAAVMRLLVTAGIPAPVPELPVHDERGNFVARLDLGWPAARVGVELQSKRWHLTEQGFERDPMRRNRLLRLGWLILDYTWRFYVETPLTMVREIREAVHERTPPVDLPEISVELPGFREL